LREIFLSSTEFDATPLELDTLIFQQMLSEGQIEDGLAFSNDLLSRSRSHDERDHLIETRLRMDRALIGSMDEATIGQELRWCVDRLNAIEPGSPLHGLALLNLANWHTNKGEQMMALVVHSDINKLLGHPNDIRGLSRLESARILVEIGDLDPAMRHLWTAKLCFINEGMIAENLVSSLEWLNLALDEVDSSAPTMMQRIEKSAPRSVGGNTWIASNPDDVQSVVEELAPVLMSDLSGDQRNDLGLILDAGVALKTTHWAEIMRSRLSEVQDSRLIDVLQS
tara:strand:- start:321 stop:1166 length:846 start_codon:yes stop_codon:yes gene_type:complete